MPIFDYFSTEKRLERQIKSVTEFVDSNKSIFKLVEGSSRNLAYMLEASSRYFHTLSAEYFFEELVDDMLEELYKREFPTAVSAPEEK